MSMQQNTIGGRHRGRMSKGNRASARAARALERLTLRARLTFLSRGPVPRYCVSDVQHLMGERPQIELTLYRSDFGFSSGLSRWKRNGCDGTATANNGSAALDERPSRSSRALLQFGLRVHHDRSVPSDGFPKQFPQDEHPSSPAWTVT
jgi:hypothetical protein